MAVEHILFKTPDIPAAVRPSHSALPSLQTVSNRAQVCTTVSVTIAASPRLYTVFELPRITVSRCVLICATAVRFIVIKGTDILIPAGITIGPLTREEAVFKVPNIYISSQRRVRTPGFGAATVSFTIFEVSDIRGAIHIGISALAVFFVVFKIASIFTTICVGIGALAILFVVSPVANVFIATSQLV